MVTRNCLKCEAKVEADWGVSGALGGQQLRTIARCPACATLHRLFESGQWTLAPDGDEPPSCDVCGGPVTADNGMEVGADWLADSAAAPQVRFWRHATCTRG